MREMKLSFKVVTIFMAFIFALPVFSALRLQDGEICFCNLSTNLIVITDLSSNGKALRWACGVLIPDGHATYYDERMFPLTIPRNFEIQYQDEDGKKHTNEIDSGWIKARTAQEGNVCFIFTPEQKFILKIYLDTGGENSRLDGLLLPDEENPAFKSYKELTRASIDGKAQRVRELLAAGTPYQWPNDPISTSPLQWSVRWNRKEVFDILIDKLPRDFYPCGYYNAIKMAAQDGREDMLKRLLQADLAREIPNPALQEIFYHACDHNKSNPARTNEIETLKILLNHFKVGFDYVAGDYGHTLLFVAVMSDDKQLATWLLNQGANPNAKLKNGFRPSNLARSGDMKKLLSDHGGL